MKMDFNSDKGLSVHQSFDYFKSYEDLEVHRLMLLDKVRNKAYKEAISNNIPAFRNKVILDVGAGTGILSAFCAKAGARTVYAVEASNTYKIAQELVKENNYEDIIQVIPLKIEDVDLPEKVDVIVSEWMGFYLLHESMLDSIIFARDKFLKEGGLLFPEVAALYAAPCSMPSMFEYWDNVEGVSMKGFGEKIRELNSKKPIIETVPQADILCDGELITSLDLRKITRDDIESIGSKFVAVAKRPGKYQGLCIWFTCMFPDKYLDIPVVLSTEPYEAPTHWKQTVILLPVSIPVEKGTPIGIDLLLTKTEKNSRKYSIQLNMLDPEEMEHEEGCGCYFTRCILVRAMLEKYESADYKGDS